MMLNIDGIERDCWVKLCRVLIMTAAFAALMISEPSQAQTVKQHTFTSPEAAVKALDEAVNSKDVSSMEAIFGPGSKELVSSGDPVSDNARYDKFKILYGEKNKLQEESAEKVVLYLGNNDWPFPIPIVKKNGLWYFDAREGREEILARRIGENELSAIQVCLAYVDAQREYAIEDRNGDAQPEYAQKFSSDPGKKNGLYWKVKEGENQSPLGPLVAEANKQGYTKKGDKHSPFHGYFYRILKAQGKNAPGGAYDYIIQGKMIGGFALVAYPAQYASSGIMTFIVNHDGVVYQKDLGRQTGKTAQAMKRFNPDSTWKKVDQKDLKAEDH
jgi:hypothetical protein